MIRVVMLIVLFRFAAFEESNARSCLEEIRIRKEKRSYGLSVNSSITVEREDRILLDSWTVGYQVKRVNVTTLYRMQMITHEEHSFRGIENEKWSECLCQNHKQIRKFEKDYYAAESECLSTTIAQERDKRLAVDQVAKEMRKWRKTYRYLVNMCEINNPDDKGGADACLVRNMEIDNYKNVIKRLTILKQQYMNELHQKLEETLNNLEECLKTQLSSYLESVRLMMALLAKCYSDVSVVDAS